jgi:hypothetical protein
MKKNYAELKVRAEHLVLIDGLTQKEVGQLLSLPEKTISQWSSKGKWKAKKGERTEAIIKINVALTGFVSYLNDVAPEIYEQVSKHQRSYLKLLRI